MNKEDLFWMMYNDRGFTQLDLAYNYTGKDGHLYFSQWMKYHDLLHLHPHEQIKTSPIHETRQQFMSKVSHRSIAPWEIIIDIDDKEIPLQTWYENESDDDKESNNLCVYTFPTIRDKAEWVCNELDKRIKTSFSITHEIIQSKIEYTCWWTGSKSYHITLFIPYLNQLSKYERSRFKEKVLWYYGGDMMKTGDRCMISCENVRHWRSGKYKKQVYLSINKTKV